jgi:multicomponent Na+:H+ antiporter subunit G
MILGALFILISAIGVVRFNDFYSRIHASTKATSFGVLLVLVSVALFFKSWNVTIKTIMVIVFVYLTAPLAAHSIAKSFNDKSNKTKI